MRARAVSGAWALPRRRSFSDWWRDTPTGPPNGGDGRDYRRICTRMGLDLSPRQHRACAYLERHGYQFLVHFGYENAPDKANALRRAKRDEAAR